MRADCPSETSFVGVVSWIRLRFWCDRHDVDAWVNDDHFKIDTARIIELHALILGLQSEFDWTQSEVVPI